MQRSTARRVVWAGVLVSLLILMLGAVSLGLIVGDWLFTETHAYWLTWAVSLIVVFGVVLAPGVGLGLFMYWHHSPSPAEEEAEVPEYHVTDTMETLLTAAQERVGRD